MLLSRGRNPYSLWNLHDLEWWEVFQSREAKFLLENWPLIA